MNELLAYIKSIDKSLGRIAKVLEDHYKPTIMKIDHEDTDSSVITEGTVPNYKEGVEKENLDD